MDDPLTELHQLIFTKNFLRIIHLLDLFDKSEKGCVLRNHFARFLGAYYLDLPLFIRPIQNGLSGFPKLSRWIAECEDDETTVLWLDRTAVAKALPSQCSPKFVVILFLEAGAIREALDFLTQFSDLKSNVLLRVAASRLDNHSDGFPALDSYLQQKFLSPWCESVLQLCSAEPANELKTQIQNTLPILSFLELTIPIEFFSNIQMDLIKVMRNEVGKLSLVVPGSVSLPRIPIYCPQDSNTSASTHEESEIILRIAAIIQILMEILVARRCFFKADFRLLLDLLQPLRGLCNDDEKYVRLSNRILALIDWDLLDPELRELSDCESLQVLDAVFRVALFLQARDRFSAILRKYWNSKGSVDENMTFDPVLQDAIVYRMFLDPGRKQDLANLLQHNFDGLHETEQLKLVDILVSLPDDLEKGFFFAVEFYREKYPNNFQLCVKECNCSMRVPINSQSHSDVLSLIRDLEGSFPNQNAVKLPNTIPLMVKLSSTDLEPFLANRKIDSPSFKETSSDDPSKNEREVYAPDEYSLSDGLNRQEEYEQPTQHKTNETFPEEYENALPKPKTLIAKDNLCDRDGQSDPLEVREETQKLSSIENRDSSHNSRLLGIFDERGAPNWVPRQDNLSGNDQLDKNPFTYGSTKKSQPDVPVLKGLSDSNDLSESSTHPLPHNAHKMSLKHLSLASSVQQTESETETDDEFSAGSISDLLKCRLGLAREKRYPHQRPKEKMQQFYQESSSTSDDKSTDSDVESLPFDEPRVKPHPKARNVRRVASQDPSEGALSPARLNHRERKRKEHKQGKVKTVLPSSPTFEDCVDEPVPKLNFRLLNLDGIKEIEQSYSKPLNEFKLLTLPPLDLDKTSQNDQPARFDREVQTEIPKSMTANDASTNENKDQPESRRESPERCITPIQSLKSVNEWRYIHLETLSNPHILC